VIGILLFYGVFLLSGLFLAFHPMILSGFARLQTDAGDTMFNHYLLEHGYRWATRWPQHHSFWDAPFFHPFPNVMAYSDALLGAAPVYWVYRLLGFPELAAYPLWMFSMLALNFVAMAALLRDGLKLGRWGAAAGAFLFAFASMRVQQMGHQQLLPHFMSVWALHALLCAFRASLQEGRGARARVTCWLLIAALGFVAQLYSGFYLGWMMGLGLGVSLLWALLLPGTGRQIVAFIRRDWLAIGIAGVLGGLALYPIARHYLSAAATVGVRDISVVFEPKLQSWFYLGEGSWLFEWQEKIRMFEVLSYQHEQKIGLGVLTWILTVAGLAPLWRQNGWMKVMCLAAGTVVLATTRVHTFFYFWPVLFHRIPGAVAVRALSRIGLLMLIPAAFAFGKGIDAALDWSVRRFGARTARGVVSLLCLVCIVEQGRTTPSFAIQPWMQNVRRVASQVGPQCHSFYLSSPPVPEGSAGDAVTIELHMQAMWAGLQLGDREIPVINGYSGNEPPGWVLSFRDLVSERAWLNDWVKRNGLDPKRTCWVE
jgi:hypothetical protein